MCNIVPCCTCVHCILITNCCGLNINQLWNRHLKIGPKACFRNVSNIFQAYLKKPILKKENPLNKYPLKKLVLLLPKVDFFASPFLNILWRILIEIRKASVEWKPLLQSSYSVILHFICISSLHCGNMWENWNNYIRPYFRISQFHTRHFSHSIHTL